MPKTKFHFMLHHLCKMRNEYTEYCYSVNKYPLLPSAKRARKSAENSNDDMSKDTGTTDEPEGENDKTVTGCSCHSGCQTRSCACRGTSGSQ